jgi:hypothetical protein
MYSLIKSVLVLLLFAGCKGSVKHSTVSSITSSRTISHVALDSIAINGGIQAFFVYPNFSTINMNGDLFFYGYNEARNKIDIFNLDAEEFVGDIQLSKDGPDGTPNIRGIAVVSPDSILVLGNYKLAIVNSQGKVSDYFDINTSKTRLANHDTETSWFWADDNFRIHFDRSRQTLYGLNHSMRYGQCDPERFESTNVLAGINLSERTFSELPIPYSDIYKENGSKGFLDFISTSFSGDMLYYNFAADPNIYTYNLRTKEKAVFGAESKLTSNKVTTIPWSACGDVGGKFKHYKNEVQFGRVLVDEKRGLFYRIHLSDIKDQLPSGQNTTKNDKSQIITVFDSSLNIIDEFELDERRYFTELAFVGPKGLYLSAPVGSQEILAFHIYDFKIQTNKISE